MKTIGYLIFAGFYYIFRAFCRIRHQKVFGIMTHDSSEDGNVGVMVKYLRERSEGYTFQFIKKTDRMSVKDIHKWKAKLSFFIIKPYHLATSEFVLLDNVFLPMAYLCFSKKVQVIQLWHGTGTIKRFGQDVNTGRLKSLEKRANSRITHLIVNSEVTKKEYSHAFGVTEDRVFLYGLPRTDIFFDEKQIEGRKQIFYKKYPDLVNKKLILYAPTFRDTEKDKPELHLDMARLQKALPEDHVILLRLHPFVMEALKKDGLVSKDDKKVISMSSYADINTLLLVSDYLITDYSSVIFEYCLLERPMIFYAYDLEEFSDNGRGFYQPYERFVPGPVLKDTEEMIKLLLNNQFETERIRDFVKKNYEYLDGKSAERIYLHIFKKNTDR